MIGVLLSAPKNAYYAYLFKKQKVVYNPKSYQCLGAYMINEELPNAAEIDFRFETTKTVNIDMDAFYAYEFYVIEELFDGSDMKRYTEGSVACHWFGGWEHAGKWINKITHENYKEFKTVFTKTIEKALDE